MTPSRVCGVCGGYVDPAVVYVHKEFGVTICQPCYEEDAVVACRQREMQRRHPTRQRVAWSPMLRLLGWIDGHHRPYRDLRWGVQRVYASRTARTSRRPATNVW